MESSAGFISEYFGNNEPLSDAEIDQLASALYMLAVEGVAVPKQLLRHSYTGDLSTSRHYGHTLDAIPPALDRLGTDRETVVVGLISRFEQAVKDHHDHVNKRKRDVTLDRNITQRCFDVVSIVGAAKPKTEKSVIEVTDFLRSDKQWVHEKASEMLQGAPYLPVIIDRLLENVAIHGIRQWPNRQSRTLASFAYVPEVRLRLMNCFHSEQENLRYVAVMAFSHLRENAGADAEAELFVIAESDENKLQSAALDGLRVITPRSERLRQLALRLIRSDKYWVRGNAIACLEQFADRESIDALLAALLDKGGPDFDNADKAAKLLEKMPLDAGHVLSPLMTTLNNLLEREDKAYEGQAGLRADVQTLANFFKSAAEERGEPTDGVGVVSYASPETLLAVARVLGRLGGAAQPALPLIEECFARPYVAGASDGEEWRKILETIRNYGESTNSGRGRDDHR